MQKELLKLQLDPHFVFNSLSTLTELISEDPDLAETFTLKFSTIYRYIVNQLNKETVSIAEEIRVIREYCDLLDIRHPHHFVFQIEEELQHDGNLILPMAIQILVENAVKHNAHSSRQPLHVSIYREGDYIVVRNHRIPLKGTLPSTTKVGLKNLDERYGLYGLHPITNIRLEDGDVFEAFLQASPKAPVIFTTAYNEYALEAFRSNGIAYLQKPIVPQELAEAVSKAKKLIADDHAPQDYSALLESLGLKKQQTYREHFLVQNNDGYTVLNVQDINHISTENGITRAFLHNGRSMSLNYSLNDIEAQLDPAKFFRANRQYVIGIDSIERINFLFNYKLSVRLKVYPNVDIIVSKEKSAQLKEWIDR